MNLQTLTAPAREEVTFGVTDMTCASCVRRIEKARSKVDGVQQAEVNLATEKARVAFDPSVAGLAQLTGAVEKAGYRVGDLPTSAPSRPANGSVAPARVAGPLDEREREREAEIRDLKRKSLISLGVGLAMMALMYLPLNLDLVTVAPILLVAATIVQFWAGAVFYRAAWAAARHGGTNMNTLVAVGTSVAYAYSAFVTLWPTLAQRWGFPIHLYYETGGHHHRPDPHGPLARGTRQEADQRRDHRAEGAPSPAPAARALGPPSAEDSQALLQVFRI